jgi:hypothetical protein
MQACGWGMVGWGSACEVGIVKVQLAAQDASSSELRESYQFVDSSTALVVSESVASAAACRQQCTRTCATPNSLCIPPPLSPCDDGAGDGASTGAADDSCITGKALLGYCCVIALTPAGDTTAVGEAMPGPQGRLANRPAGGLPGPGLAPTTPSSRSGMVQALTYPLAMGFGVGLTFALIRMLIG